MIRIVTDSSSDIPEHLADVFEIEVIPLLITFGKEEFREGVDISSDEFYERLVREAPRLPKTSIPSIGEVAEIYQEILDDGDEIISIHLSSALSGMYNVAVQAAKQVDPRGRYITSIDSRNVSMCLGWTAIKAAEMTLDDEPKEEIIKYIYSILPRLRIPSFLDTLEFIKYGGRIGTAAAFFGTALDLKPLLQLKEGKVSPLARVRTRGRAMDRLVQLASQMGPFDDLAVMHTYAPGLAKKLAQKLGQHGIHPYKNILIAETGVAMGTHTGPNSIGLCAVVSK
jgi:DegV family protein with EDD domain